MQTTDKLPDDSKALFKESFTAVVALAKEEWPTLDADKLSETAGDLDRAVALIASHLDRTKVAIRKQLLELCEVARAHSVSRASANGSAKRAEPGPAPPNLPPLDDVFAAIRRLESFATEEARRVSDKYAPVAESRVRKNVWLSLLMALGFGLILGLWLNGGRRR